MIEYLRISHESELPDIKHLRPFKSVVVVESPPGPGLQLKASDWLVKSGCLYMMAWGHECSSWDDSVDAANLEEFDYADIPDESFVMTTWHSDQLIEEVFWFAKHNANHPTLQLNNLVILHIGGPDKSELFKSMYVSA